MKPVRDVHWNREANALTATRVGRFVTHLDVMLVQRCATLEEYTHVRAATGLPMKLDEYATDMASVLDVSAGSAFNVRK